jgi:hypothetical protein
MTLAVPFVPHIIARDIITQLLQTAITQRPQSIVRWKLTALEAIGYEADGNQNRVNCKLLRVTGVSGSN